MSKFYLAGRTYRWLIEPFLIRIKLRITKSILDHHLFPALDICCGTGRQCHLIQIDSHAAYGLDLDFKMLNYAAHVYPEIPFVCADAVHIPLRNAYFKGIIISYALHDKPFEQKAKMLNEAKRLLSLEGRIILADFEKPWNVLSRLCGFFMYFIERMAGKEHFRNGRQFLGSGGLRRFMRQNGLVEIERYDFDLGQSSVVIAKFG